jgi:hypothetical protein
LCVGLKEPLKFGILTSTQCSIRMQMRRQAGGGGNKEQRAESKSQINLGSKVNSSQQSTTDKNRRKSIINPTIFRTSAINIKR